MIRELINLFSRIRQDLSHDEISHTYLITKQPLARETIARLINSPAARILGSKITARTATKIKFLCLNNPMLDGLGCLMQSVEFLCQIFPPSAQFSSIQPRSRFLISLALFTPISCHHLIEIIFISFSLIREKKFVNRISKKSSACIPRTFHSTTLNIDFIQLILRNSSFT